MTGKINVAISGALGRMGREASKAVDNDPELELIGLIDIKANKEMKSDITGNNEKDFNVITDIKEFLENHKPDVVVDFTNPHAVFQNAKIMLDNRINCVIGTTGLENKELIELEDMATKNSVGLAVIPNFAIGAVLMMKMASEAAKYLPDAEIIELHHNQKIDAPSGTAIKTAEMIAKSRNISNIPQIKEIEKLAGARGAKTENIHIHSVRLPGLIAHQEVILGGIGQTLTIRHDSYDRNSFMPGVLLTIKKIKQFKGLVYGLEKFL